MLTLKTTNGYLDIGEISISLVFKSPVFNDADGSYSYNFNLPATDNNRKIFAFPHRIESKSNTPIEVECELYFSGLMFLSGIMLVKQANEELYECTLGTGKGEFNFIIKDKFLSVLDFGGERVLAADVNDVGDAYTDTTTKAFPESDFVAFPVQNSALFVDTNVNLENVYRNYFYINNYWIDNEFPEILTSGSGDVVGLNIFIPMVYNSYILQQIFNYAGYLQNENVFTIDQELNRLVFWNVFVENELKAGMGYYYMSPKLSIDLKNHIPELTITNYFTSLKVLFGAVCFINNNTKHISIKLIKDILKNGDIIDFSDNISVTPKIKYESNKGLNFKMTGDPDDDYWTAYVKTLADLNVLTSVADQTALPLIGNNINDCRLCIVENFYYVWCLDESDGTIKWLPFCYNYFEEYSSGGVDSNLESYISTVLELPWPWEDNSDSAHVGGDDNCHLLLCIMKIIKAILPININIP